MKEYTVANMLICPPWMGKYPRKGADWSPEEDAALLRAYESGRHLNKDIAAMHMREPVAIERRLGVLRNYRAWDEARKNRVARLMLDEGVFGGTPGGGKTWASERETARRAVSKIKEEFAHALWPRQQELRRFKVGDIVNGRVVVAIRAEFAVVMLSSAELSDLPPEVAQALQFGGEE